MPKPRPSVLKRQREQVKRERKAAKAEKRTQRKDSSVEGGGPEIDYDAQVVEGEFPAEE